MEKIQKFEEFVLGKDERCNISTDCKKTQLNNNIMVIGGSGSGKTSGVLNPMLLNMTDSNVVAVFAKKGESKVMAEVLKKRGYRVMTINLAEPKNSEYGYDPLHYAETDEDIFDLAHSIIMTDEKGRVGKDPFWENSATNLLDFLIRYVKSGKFPEGRDMKAVCALMDELIWPGEIDETDFLSKYDELFPPENYGVEAQNNSAAKTTQMVNEELCQEDKKEVERKKLKRTFPLLCKITANVRDDKKDNNTWRNFLQLGSITGTCVLTSMMTPFNNMFNLSARKFLENKNSFDIKELLKPKTALFLYISPTQRSNYKYLSIIYSQLFKTLFKLADERESGELPYHVHVLCDDFAAGCPVTDFEKHISTFREKGIAATMLVQSQSQLDAIYGEKNATTIINNCDTLIFLGGMDINTCQSVATRLDRPYSEVQNMQIGEEIFIRRGQKPFLTKRIDFRDDKNYKRAIAKRKEREMRSM